MKSYSVQFFLSVFSHNYHDFKIYPCCCEYYYFIYQNLFICSPVDGDLFFMLPPYSHIHSLPRPIVSKPWKPVIYSLFSIFVISRMLYKWNHVMCDHFRLPFFFTQHNALKIQSSRCM